MNEHLMSEDLKKNRIRFHKYGFLSKAKDFILDIPSCTPFKTQN